MLQNCSSSRLITLLCSEALKQVGSNTPLVSHDNLAHHVRYTVFASHANLAHHVRYTVFASHANLAHHVRYTVFASHTNLSHHVRYTVLPHTPTLFIMSDTQSAEHKTTALMVAFLKAFKHEYLTKLSGTLFIYYSVAKEKGP